MAQRETRRRTWPVSAATHLMPHTTRVKRAIDRYGIQCGTNLATGADYDAAHFNVATGETLVDTDHFIVIVAIERQLYLYDRDRSELYFERISHWYAKSSLEAADTLVDTLLTIFEMLERRR